MSTQQPKTTPQPTQSQQSSSLAITPNPMSQPQQLTVSAQGTGGVAAQSIMVGNISYRFPLDKTMRSAVKLSIQNDKPIMMDYWTDSLDKKISIGLNANKERYLIKSMDEYTSMINKLYNMEPDIICETFNSIYIISSGIGTKKISS